MAVVLVPLFSTLISRCLPGVFAISGVAAATAGLGLLTLGDDLRLGYGDLLVFCCAVCFALHIIAVGRYARQHRPILLATVQIGTVAAVSFFLALGLETWPGEITRQVWVALLVTAIPATSLAYLVQNSVQQYTSPTHTAIIFTMEPVFAALAAFYLAGEILTAQQLAGCALILTGMLVAELKSAAPASKSPSQNQ